MADDFGHCEALVRSADKDRYVSALYAPTQHRPALHALYAFNIEIVRIREQAHAPLPGEIRQQWWRDVLNGVGSGQGSPVASALTETVARYCLPVRDLVDLIEARSFDLYEDPMGTLMELEAYCEKTSSAIMRLAARILNDGNELDVDMLTRHAGIAYAIAGILEALPVHVRRRQLFVPLELLHDHGARAEDALAGSSTPALGAALAAMRRVALRHLERARPLIASIPPALVPAVLPAALVRPVLMRMERRGYDPFAPRPLPQWRRQWLLLRAARNLLRIAE